MLNMETVDNFRTFERDSEGNELHMTDKICSFCDKPSEVYIKVNGNYDYDEILFCKTCLSKGEQLWNEAFLKNAKRNRQEQEAFLIGE
jgi:hypothetical protein